MSNDGHDLLGSHLVKFMLERAFGRTDYAESGRTPVEVDEDSEQKRRMRPPVFLLQRPGSTGIRVVESATLDMANVAARVKFESSEELERFLEPYGKTGQVPTLEPASPFFEAQRIIYETLGASRKRQIRLAKKALSVCPNCADAYTILAGFEDDPENKRTLLELACEAGKAALEDEGIVIEEEERGLWSVMQGRPYLRAKLALANFLYETAKKREALALYEDILRLNPGDNQGVRYILVGLYLELDMLEEARRFLRKRRDDFPVWDYAEAYITYREKGDCLDARKALRRGFCKNPRVVRYLLGEEELPEHLPDSSADGTDEEAQIVASLIIPYWRRTAGETSWTADTVDEESGLFPNPYSWLKDVIEETTAGLWPVEVLDTRRMREKISAVWEKVITDGRIKKDELFLAEILRRHSEFDPVFFLNACPSHQRFLIDGMDPISHVVAHYVVEGLFRHDGPVADELRKTIGVLVNAGLGRHEATHLLMELYARDWASALSGNEPFDTGSFISQLRFVRQVALGAFRTVADGGPSRNDPCLCGSGRKFKKCCGREDWWPMDTLRILAEEINLGGGEISSAGCPGLTMVLWEDSRYVDIVKGLGQDDSILSVVNAFAVVEKLAHEGHSEDALLGGIRNMERALQSEVRELAVAVAIQVLAIAEKVPSLAPLAEERAGEVFRDVQDGALMGLYWYVLAGKRLARRDIDGAKQAVEQGLPLLDSLTPEFSASFMFLAAMIRKQCGDLGEAREYFGKVLAVCDANRGTEWFHTMRAKAARYLADIEAHLDKV